MTRADRYDAGKISLALAAAMAAPHVRGLIFLSSPFLQKLLGAIIWILVLTYLFGSS